MTSLLCTLLLAPLAVPRTEHPRPDLRRSEWTSLNGQWEFAETDDDNDVSWLGDKPFPDKITVPFCRESKLSGLERKGFVKNVWYRRTFTRPNGWKSPRTLLHIGASDWRSTVWVNGHRLGMISGGSSPLTFEVTRVLRPGENTVVVQVFDDTRSGLQALGKQCPELDSYGCLYTRTTGIWQSVWLEGVGAHRIDSLRTIADSKGRLSVRATVDGQVTQGVFEAELSYAGTRIVRKSVPIRGRSLAADIKVAAPKLWAPGRPNLYDLTLTVRTGDVVSDVVSTYVGFRDVQIKGRAILINGKPVFQRLVLDQGFYPDGVWTAPSDDELRKDIERSMAAGFNGARLHQKVFEPRFLYWADRLGYLVWGEFPNWGLNYKDKRIEGPVMLEWARLLDRDRNHPSIVGWCPFNETPAEAGPLQDNVVAYTRKTDPTRPVIDTSGYIHSVTDPMVLDAHDYDQNPVSFGKRWRDFFGGNGLPARYGGSGKAPGVPFMVSEYGGIGWDTGAGWGYGNGPKTLEEFYARFKGLTDAQLDNPNLFGYCYTQLTDVEQERNGIYKYDRTPKFDLGKLKAIQSRPAAIERGVKQTARQSGSNWSVLVGSVRDAKPMEWRYTESKPAEAWRNPGFDASAWSSGRSGFGSKGGWEADTKTPWASPDIWLRGTFHWDGKRIDGAALALHYDNATEVYVNGKLVWKSAPGAWNDAFENIDVTAALKQAIVKGQNTLAAHVHQDTGGQYFDLALLVR